MFKLKRLVQVIAVLSTLGLCACLSSSVKNLFITGVKLTPANPTIAINSTQQFVLTATYVGGQTANETTNDSTYSSDNKAVATVNTVGLATGISAGTANILASYHGNNTKTLLTVTVPANVASTVQGDSRVLHVTNLRTGQRMTFAANGLSDSLLISHDGDSGASAEISVLPERGPGWLAIDPSANYLYVLNQTSATISAFVVNWKTGSSNRWSLRRFPRAQSPGALR